MAHGRELRIYRKLLIDRAIQVNANKLDFGSERGDCPQFSLPDAGRRLKLCRRTSSPAKSDTHAPSVVGRPLMR